MRDSAHRSGFTILELLMVIFIVILIAGLMIPALGTSSARALDGASRQFVSDLQNARLLAMAERTRTRVFLPTSSSNFAGASSSPAPWPNDIALQGYVIASEKKTAGVWRQRGKWNRFPQGTAVQSYSPAPSPTAIPVDATGQGTTTGYTYSGPYIEFLANGSSNLDPTATPATTIVADGFVDSNGVFQPKNRGLVSSITIDPLSGSVSLK